MAAGPLDLLIEQGATFTWPMVWKDDAGVPINLTGYTARMHVRFTLAAPVTLLELTTLNGRITLGTTGGQITLSLTATETAALLDWPANKGVYDLEMVSSGGQVTRLLKGTITLDPEVTR